MKHADGEALKEPMCPAPDVSGLMKFHVVLQISPLTIFEKGEYFPTSASSFTYRL